MTPGCYICDPAAFDSDEEPCMECFMRWYEHILNVEAGRE